MTKTELNKLYKDYTSEFDDLSVHEFKLLLAYRMELRGITRWDDFMDDFVERNRKYHQDYLINLGVEVDKEDQKSDEEVEAKDAVKH